MKTYTLYELSHADGIATWLPRKEERFTSDANALKAFEKITNNTKKIEVRSWDDCGNRILEKTITVSWNGIVGVEA